MKIVDGDMLRYNMKLIVFVLVSVLMFPFVAFAQISTDAPGAGLTPESRWYFIEEWSESLQEFFTFKPENKARLQIAFAAERVAEIGAILEARGVDAEGLGIAEARLREHLADAAAIVADQKSRGDDVSGLARELGDEFKESRSALAETFKTHERVLESNKDELEAKLKAARRARDTATVEELTRELARAEDRLNLLEQTQEDLDEELEEEEETLEDLEDPEDAEVGDDLNDERGKEARKQIAEAEKKRREVEYEMNKEGVQIPATSFETYDRLLAQAKDMLSKDDFVGAIKTAKQAKASLESVKQGAEQQREGQKQEDEQAKKEAEQQAEAQKKLLEQQQESQKQQEGQ